MPSDPLLWQILLQAALIALNAVFACAEIAVISINDAKLSHMAASGNKNAARLEKLTSQPARFLATIQVAITLAGFLGSAFAADNFSQRLVDALLKAGWTIPEKTLDTLCVILITLVLSFFTLVLGELVPKRVAMQNSEKLGLGLAGLLSFISKAFAPIVWLLTASTNGILRLLGIDPNARHDEVSEEEIRMMIDVGNEKGTIDAEEQRMLQNVFEFDDISAGELTTHRTQLDLLYLEDDPAVWEETIRTTRHSFYPICADSPDNITAILNAKDYFRLKERTRENILSKAVAEPYFVPETIKADVLFTQMRANKNHFAVVLDEYSGVTGVITMNDLLEEIVGNLAEADDKQECLLERTPTEGLWRMSGAVPLDAVTDALHIELPTDEFETLGGLIFAALSAVPRDGSHFSLTASGMDIQVTRVRKHRIEEALVRLAPAAPTDTPSAPQES